MTQMIADLNSEVAKQALTSDFPQQPALLKKKKRALAFVILMAQTHSGHAR